MLGIGVMQTSPNDQQAQAGDRRHVQRIDPDQPRPQETTEAEVTGAALPTIEVRGDEPGGDEEQLRAEIAVVHQAAVLVDGQAEVEAELIEHHPGQRDELQPGQGGDRFRIR